MALIAIKNYEISVWEDKLVTESGVTKLQETKLAVIGSDTMTAVNRVYEPVFNKKSNGEKTLTFSLKYKYFDPHSGNDDVINPFVSLLTNERKVKLYYQNKWYEFVVKDHTESSDEYTWTYTCTDAFVAELSKTGYGIVIDSELGNNQGTAKQLATTVLQDTGWQVGTVNVGKQYVAEPVYKATLYSTEGVTIYDPIDGITPPSAGTAIYLFYSYVKEKNGAYVQFIIRDDNRNYVIDDNNVITDTNFRISNPDNDYEPLVYRTANGHTGFWLKIGDNSYRLIIDIVKENGQLAVEDRYQVNRLVLKLRTTYDPVMERTVNLYKVGETDQRIVYGYTDSSYVTSDIVTTFISNGTNFDVVEEDTVQGWGYYNDATSISVPSTSTYFKPQIITKPSIGGVGSKLTDLNSISSIESFLKVRFNNGVYFPGIGSNSNIYNTIYNSGINNNLTTLGSISKGEKFIFRYRAGTCTNENINNYTPTTALRMIVAKFTKDKDGKRHIKKSDVILRFKGTEEGATGSRTLNNVITGGRFNSGSKKTQYIIDDVVQTPSTKYVYRVGGTDYVWNPSSNQYVTTANKVYHPYYYLEATATKSVTHKDLSKGNYGIFIYSCANSYYDRSIVTDPIDPTKGRYYYIQDIQLTRYFPDGDTGQPAILGNIPTSSIYNRTYYYEKPKSGATADTVSTYTTKAGLAQAIGTNEQITGLYNNSEKVLSITASQSNCFNILQTIAETFECWIELDVRHDSNGYIQYTNGVPEKYVNIRQYAGKDNWAGFKYGINLQSIERNINSEEIVTKLIVDQTQSDYVENGHIAISDANSNPSGEDYILNFNYYYSQGLLNKTEVEADKIAFIKELTDINKTLKSKESERESFEASLVSIESETVVYSELIDAAQDDLTQAKSDFQKDTGMAYSTYVKKYNNTLSPTDTLTDVDAIVDVIGRIYADSATINNYSGLLTNANTSYTNTKASLDGQNYYVVKIWTERDVNNQRHVFVEIDDFFDGLKITLSGHSQETSSLSQRVFEWTDNSANTLTFALPSGSDYQLSQQTYTIVNTKTGKITITKTSGSKKGIKREIEEIIEDKKEIIRAFELKYGHYIQEGTWSSTDYIDSELYYLDALQVSNTSAFPTVSYTINVVEISELNNSASYIYDPENINQLTSYEAYIFDAGDKTYVEDTEFFGYNRQNVGTTQNPQYVYTPAREEVIVSEVEWHLDEPDKNTITVQNYKTRFEDLFQRINATVQTVQYNEATYAKTSTLLDANGTLNQNVLLNSMNAMAGKEYSLTSDGSIIVSKDSILIQNLTNQSNRVIINSEGIRVSSDGGETWSTVIDGKGINLGAVYSGSINTDEITIGNKDQPSFRWDNSGLSAYGSKSDIKPVTYVLTEDTTLVSGKTYYELINDIYTVVTNPTAGSNPNELLYYEAVPADTETITDLKTFVRFDKFGIYGVQNYPNFVANNLEEIKNNAHFAVTWDGFFIKNSYEGGGRVEITSDNDFRVLNTVNQQENEKVKIGALEWLDENGQTTTNPEEGVGAPTLYGIRIRNDAGTTVMQTDDNGNLTITGTINANAGNIGGMTVNSDKLTMNTIVLEPGVGIYSNGARRSNEHVFIISDTDGSATFNNITARGHIEAVTGTLGQLTVQDTIVVGDENYTGVIRSKNYTTGQSGWRIDSNGLAEFQNAVVRGEINATSGVFSGNVQVGTENSYITIDGINASIKSSNYGVGAAQGWMIDKNGDAIFNNITARGAIKTAVFEYAEIQAVGGVFIFRPSSTIRTAAIDNETIIYVKTKDTEIISEKIYYTYDSANDEYDEVAFPVIADIDDYYEQVSSLILTVEKPQLFKNGQWCKVSNYTNNGEAENPDVTNILLNNGLTHVYEVLRIQGSNNIILLGAAAMVEGPDAVCEINDLIGGSLIDMGNKARTSNYGIGINSSDNTVNLPARAISLFETIVDETQEPKVTYNYKGILGTLPYLPYEGPNAQVSILYDYYMKNKQGIYTNNMYIGDKNQYMAFYNDGTGNKLRIVAKEFMVLADDNDLIDLTNSIVEQRIEYNLSTSDTVNTKEIDWTTVMPTPDPDEYLWERTYILYGKGTVSYIPDEDGYYVSTQGTMGPPGPQGQPGTPGEDAITVEIVSSNGNVFKTNSINTVLTVTVYKGATIIKNITQLVAAFGSGVYLQWYWKRITDNDFVPIPSNSSMISNNGFTLTLTPTDVSDRVVFQCGVNTSS